MRDFLDRDYTHKLLGCAYAVHSALGPGLLESIYEKALCYELQSQGFEVRNQVPVKVKYRDISLDMNQLLTYMRLTGIKLGYIINFNEYSLKDGIERIVNDFW